MRPTFRKLEVKDIGNLEHLVADNAEGIEAGLKVVDTRLLLGQAVIDLVGLDANGSLVLIALDLSADEGVLLRVMDAYSWCLDYPDTVRRLYPMAQVSASRPPRVLFVVDRVSDAFLRRIKQLSFLEVDCFEFRHLEVNGAPVIYFDLIERLRKPGVAAPVAAPAPAPVSIAPAAIAMTAPRVEPVGPRVEPSLWIEPPAPRVEPAPVAPRVEPVAPRVEPDAPRVERPTLMVGTAAPVEPVPIEPAPVVAVPSVPSPLPEPVAAMPTPAPESGSVRLIGTAHVEPTSPVQPALEADPVPVLPALQLEAIEATAAMVVGGSANGDGVEWTPGLVDEGIAAVSAPAELVAPSPSLAVPEAPQPQVVRVEPDPIVLAPAQTTPVWAKPQAQPNGGRPYFFAQATKGTSPAEATAAVAAPVPQPVAAKPALEVDDRPELESLSFPKDGLSRQWLEFLSQLGATK